MRKVVAPIAVTAAILLAGSLGSHSAPAAYTAAACTHVKIGATTTCLIAGRPCSPRYEQQYRVHGFKCKRNTAGQYRLWQVPLHSLPPAV